MGRLADALAVALTVARVADEHDVKYPAAALAYYAFVSLVPLLVIVLAVVGDSLGGRIYRATPRFLTPEAQRLVAESLTTASGRVGATLLAVVVLAWSGANLAVDFRTVVERVEGTPEGPLATQLRETVGVLLALGVVVAAVLAVGVFFSLPATDQLSPGWPAVLLGVLTVAFLPLYYLPSRTVTTLSGALPGALTAAVGWSVLLAVIRFYAANAGRYAIYGVLSGIIIVLTSLYLGAVVLMVGVVVNATLGGAAGGPPPSG